MYNHEPADYVCPMCQISNGEIEKNLVMFKDDVATVFIAGKWWRTAPAHLIIIPNEHIENIYDMPEDVGHHIFDLTKRVSLILKKAYSCDGVSTRQHNEPAGNQAVWHYHQHVFPRYEDDKLYLNHKDTYWPTAEEIKPYADKLRPYFS